MKKAIFIREEIKAILCQLAVEDKLPLDMSELDTSLLTPAFYNGKMRYLTVDCNEGRKVYDRNLKKYIN